LLIPLACGKQVSSCVFIVHLLKSRLTLTAEAMLWQFVLQHWTLARCSLSRNC
jgi:hypothetical protein